MPRLVVAISSQVAFGAVGNTAAVPALHAAGLTVLEVPTVFLSHHPGLGKPARHMVPAADIEAALDSLAFQPYLPELEGIMTGYFASADQAGVAAEWVAWVKRKDPDVFVLVDPVLGDEAGLYVGQAVARAIRDELMPLASCLTPNRFELSWLTGLPAFSVEDAEQAARLLDCPEILATSIMGDGDELLTLAITPDRSWQWAAAWLAGVPHGTGDFLSGLYLAARLDRLSPEAALKRSSEMLAKAIARSLGEPTLDVIGALHGA